MPLLDGHLGGSRAVSSLLSPAVPGNPAGLGYVQGSEIESDIEPERDPGKMTEKVEKN